MKSFLAVLVLHVVVQTYCQDLPAHLKEKVQEALCEAQCLDKFESSLCGNFKCESCSSPKDQPVNYTGELKLTPHSQLFSPPELLCKDDAIITVKWNVRQPTIALLEVRAKGSNWKLAGKTACTRAAIYKLKPNTDYEVRLWGISPGGQVAGPTDSIWVKTSPENSTLAPVQELNVTKWLVDDTTCTADVEWVPGEDHACFYDIVYFTFGDYDYIAVRDIDDLFRIKIPNLEFGSVLCIKITSKSLTSSHPGPAAWLNTSIPTCLEAYQNNLTQCAPPPPEDVEIQEIFEKTRLDNAIYDVYVAWKKPMFIPDYYTVELVLTDFSRYFNNVTGDETETTFYDLPLSGMYQVVIIAWSQGGSSDPSVFEREANLTNIMTIASSPRVIQSSKLSVILGSLGGVGALIIFIFIVLYRQCKSKKTIKKSEDVRKKNIDEDCKKSSTWNNITSEYYIPEIVNDEWQLNSDRLTMDVLLGEGAFGVVHKGFMTNNDGTEMEVAIKMLKGNPTIEEVRQFEHEIEIMKSVGTHPHLVSMVGCCSKIGYLGPFLVVEYCSKGDLQTYLRAAWEQISGQTLNLRYINNTSFPDDVEDENHFSNKMYEFFDDALLESKDLLSFARQIVLGMEYLSNLRVVHRDLAARNVLMCGNRIVKIADFGLSRDVYQDNIYTKTGAGKLPVKWMALESLSHQQYTTQSDVWSFGVVLWEIVTLGGNPYSTISTRDLLGLLKNGYRMECPKNCSEELYEIMCMCWKEAPKERPTFGDLRKLLEKLLENENRYISLDVRF